MSILSGLRPGRVCCATWLMLMCAATAHGQSANTPVQVSSRGDGRIQANIRDPAWRNSMVINFAQGNDGFPLVLPTDTRLQLSVADQFRWPSGTSCTALEVRVPLPVAMQFGGQSIYRLDAHHGVLLWLGDVNRQLVPLRGTGWQTVFDNFCHGQTRGYRVVAHPVLLSWPSGILRNFLYLQLNKKIADVRLRRRSGQPLQGNTQFSLHYDLNLLLTLRGVNCQISVPRQVMLTPVPRAAFQTRNEVPAATFQAQLGCPNAQVTGFVLTDMHQPTNTGLQLHTQGTASGVRLALYNERNQPLRFGHQPRPTNPWHSGAQASTQIQVKYVKTGDTVSSGSVLGMMSLHVFYR